MTSSTQAVSSGSQSLHTDQGKGDLFDLQRDPHAPARRNPSIQIRAKGTIYAVRAARRFCTSQSLHTDQGKGDNTVVTLTEPSF